MAAGQSPCSTAVAGLKLIAEADICGVHLSPFSSRKIIGLTAAHDALANDDPQLALDIFLEIAAQGVESAQTNAAFLLTRYDLLKEALETQASETESVFEALPAIVNSSNLMHSGLRVGSESIALHLYSLSSAQGNVEAFLQIGDIYYYGRAGLKPDKHAAVTSYQAGADLRHPHALFNLGLMYEIGDGVAQVV